MVRTEYSWKPDKLKSLLHSLHFTITLHVLGWEVNTEYYWSEYWILEVGKWIYRILLKSILNTLGWEVNIPNTTEVNTEYSIGWEVNILNTTEENTEYSRLGSEYTEYYWSEYWIL